MAHFGWRKIGTFFCLCFSSKWPRAEYSKAIIFEEEEEEEAGERTFLCLDFESLLMHTHSASLLKNCYRRSRIFLQLNRQRQKKQQKNGLVNDLNLRLLSIADRTPRTSGYVIAPFSSSPSS